jgi:hypothetical protein
MKIAVVIPWRPTESRLPLKNYLESWYKKNIPEAEIFYSDSGHTPFNLSASRNMGARLAKDFDIIIHNDADTVPSIEPLREGIRQTYETGYFCNPYSEYMLLDFKNTNRVIVRRRSIDNVVAGKVDGACSGIVITTYKTWKSIGGFDEKFIGWGFEDVAVAVAHGTIMEHGFLTIPGKAFAMSHEIQERVPDLMSQGRERLEKYFQASGDKELMYKLVEIDKE